MELMLQDWEAQLEPATLKEILRRYPDDVVERNDKDPHDFQVCRIEKRPRRATDEPGVRVGW